VKVLLSCAGALHTISHLQVTLPVRNAPMPDSHDGVAGTALFYTAIAAVAVLTYTSMMDGMLHCVNELRVHANACIKMPPSGPPDNHQNSRMTLQHVTLLVASCGAVMGAVMGA